MAVGWSPGFSRLRWAVPPEGGTPARKGVSVGWVFGFLDRGRGPNRPSRSFRSYSRRLLCERLEDRRLLSGNAGSLVSQTVAANTVELPAHSFPRRGRSRTRAPQLGRPARRAIRSTLSAPTIWESLRPRQTAFRATTTPSGRSMAAATALPGGTATFDDDLHRRRKRPVPIPTRSR